MELGKGKETLINGKEMNESRIETPVSNTNNLMERLLGSFL